MVIAQRINIKRLVDNINKTNVYTPIVEAIANSIDSIDDIKNVNGEIKVVLIRKLNPPLLQNESSKDKDELSPVIGVKIIDNGAGFNDKNLEAFDYIYTENKIKQGGKGFGRFVFLKYFERVAVKSIFVNGDHFTKRTFDFVKDNRFLQNRRRVVCSKAKRVKTEIYLEKLKDEHVNKLDKKIETISRKLLEKLLVYFTLDNYSCPKIVVFDDSTGESITLNNYFGQGKDISKILDKDFKLTSADNKSSQSFQAKVFKVNYGESSSSINLVADKRQVAESFLYEFIPEFKDDFYDEVLNDKGDKIKKNYVVKVYVTGKYLDTNVGVDRDSFNFLKSEADMLYPFSQRDIEKEAANIAKDAVSDEVVLRQQKKKRKVQDYVNFLAPYHKSYVQSLDFSTLPYDCDDEQIELALQKTKFGIESSTREKIHSFLKSDKFDIDTKFNEVVSSITDVGKSDLAHYVALRKLIIELFSKSLGWDDTKKYNKEKIIHELIFPTRTESDVVPYNKHNLWLIDERLCFHEYLTSDKPLKAKDDRPDILIFDQKISVRNGNEFANPIVVIEFKKPQRKDYNEEDNPLKQIGRYVEKVRSGHFNTPEGKVVNANENTPAFGFLICDLTPKIEEFCRDFDLVKCPDNQGYFGFHKSYKVYIEVISFDKLVRDAEMRNKIFFSKLDLI